MNLKNINPTKLGLAGSITVGTFYTLYSLILKFWPESILRLILETFHFKNAKNLNVEVTGYNYITGLLTRMILIYFILWTLGTAYNALSEKRR